MNTKSKRIDRITQSMNKTILKQDTTTIAIAYNDNG